MKYEECIEMFKAGIAATDCDRKKDLYATAISAIEKQIPKKVKERCSDIIFSSSSVALCTVCGMSVFSSEKYCPYCGQTIDWEWEKQL